MAQPFERTQISETDIALELLQANGRPMYYRDLIEGVLSRLKRSADPQHMAAVLTQINLDTRFAFAGEGEWGLKVWVPARGTKRMPAITLMNRSVAYDDEAKVDVDDGDAGYIDDEELDEDLLEGEDALDEEDEGSEGRDEEGWEQRD
ncbi:MAG: DNA-directed RNA polymerase subunit delta [Desulfitobacteriaceae bacterium]|nr:DNA-directed RNA polymerase subunit delta [Desulfitobacteriaceae bacterium]MDI6913629.1 DNA-directed RNA polymerase subunit delta [Desulfitobacteriaceae bacterium]